MGSGATASVHKATTRNNQEVAVKCIDRSKFSKSETESLLKEVEYLRLCDHANIISFYDFFDDEPEKYYLVVEMIKGGELFDRISEKTVYSEKDARDLIMTLLDVPPAALLPLQTVAASAATAANGTAASGTAGAAPECAELDAKVAEAQSAMLAQVVGMGFDAARAQAALERAGWNVEAALAVLLG